VRRQRDGNNGNGAWWRRWRHPDERRPPPRSFGYKYGAPPHRLRDGFTYARPLPPLYMRDLDHVLGHVSKFNGLSYNNDVYGDDGWGGKTTTKTKEDSEGHSLMRRRTDDIADKII